MACSAAWSTSVTKSFGPLLLILSWSRSSDARLMMLPAARAALMAMLSMGWSDCDMGRTYRGAGRKGGSGGKERAARTIDARCGKAAHFSRDRLFHACRPDPL